MNRRGRARLLSTVGMAALLLLASGSSALAIGTDVSISIVDAPRAQSKWGYTPSTRTIAPATWVTWSNAGQDAHSVTAVDGSFDSGTLDPSEGFSWFFDQPGTYPYVCSLHPWMTGRIIVGNGIAPDDTTASLVRAGDPQPAPSDSDTQTGSSGAN